MAKKVYAGYEMFIGSFINDWINERRGLVKRPLESSTVFLMKLLLFFTKGLDSVKRISTVLIFILNFDIFNHFS